MKFGIKYKARGLYIQGRFMMSQMNVFLAAVCLHLGINPLGNAERGKKIKIHSAIWENSIFSNSILLIPGIKTRSQFFLVTVLSFNEFFPLLENWFAFSGFFFTIQTFCHFAFSPFSRVFFSLCESSRNLMQCTVYYHRLKTRKQKNTIGYIWSQGKHFTVKSKHIAKINRTVW